MVKNNPVSSEELMSLENRYGASIYRPLPVVLSKGDGVYVWDVNGKQYFDFLSSYSAVNQGHCHPKIVEAMTQQAKTLTLTSRAFFNDWLGHFSKYIHNYFGFDKSLPMNTGAEAVETAIKICRKWGYQQKGVLENSGEIIVCHNNFHGRTISIISFSSDAKSKEDFGPFTPGFHSIPYNDIDALEKALNRKNVIGFLVEPVQGEAGVVVPDPNYMQLAKKLCEKQKVLFIADEIQSGLGRTGSLLGSCGNCTCTNACEQQLTYVRPDVLILGKALSGGTYPVSLVLADSNIMDLLAPGQHGSTYGGNPLAARVTLAALKVLKDENLIQNARKNGEIIRKRLISLKQKNNIIEIVRGKGLLNAIVINDRNQKQLAWNICLELMKNGLLAKPTHRNIIRLSPPLIITESQIYNCCDIIEDSIAKF